MSRMRNIKCFEDTVKSFKYYKNPKTIKIKEKANIDDFNVYDNTEIKVINQDCVDVAKKYSKIGKVCLLNMASDICPGGGVKNGSNAQEETLCRRSNLYNSLSSVEYPLEEFEGIMSYNVTFFKDSVDNKYQLYDQDFSCNVVSVAAYRINKNKMTESQINGTKTKIINIILFSAYSNSDILILSAFGCGAFHNPPEIIADIFYDVLVNDGYMKYFKQIIFAIIDDHNAGKDGNFLPFYKKFNN